MEPLVRELRNNTTHKLAEWVERLIGWSNINSGSDNPQGLARMHRVLDDAFTPIADLTESVSLPAVPVMNLDGVSVQRKSANALLIRKRPECQRRILLCGHMDTVFGPTHPFQGAHMTSEGVLNGPGVADMKGGILVILEALRTFEHSPHAASLGWDVFINTDEELGSPASAALLESMAPRYQAALVYEPAMTPEGMLAKNRRGSGKFTLIAHGRAAHAGRAFDEGRNAIWHLAAAVRAIHALNGERHGVNLNIGKIAGGEALNMVPDKAVLQIDVRTSSPDDEHWVEQRLREVLESLTLADYQLTLHGHFGRPVKRVNPATIRLFEQVRSIGGHLGLTLDWKDSGGCCDGNNLAHHGLAVLDTLGVRGGKIHTGEEFCLTDSIPERIALSALLLHFLAGQGLEDLVS